MEEGLSSNFSLILDKGHGIVRTLIRIIIRVLIDGHVIIIFISELLILAVIFLHIIIIKYREDLFNEDGMRTRGFV